MMSNITLYLPEVNILFLTSYRIIIISCEKDVVDGADTKR